MTDRGTKEEYQRVLGKLNWGLPSNFLPYQFFYAIEEQISERKSRERSERDYDRAVAQELVNSFYFY